MSKKETASTKEDVTADPSASADSETVPGDAGATEGDREPTESDPLKSLQESLEQVKEELADQKDRTIRLQAETDNFRKRMIREKEEFAQFANERLLKELIPIFDNLERALDSPTSDAQGLKEGVQMILKQFESFLQKEKVEPIKAVGEIFDPSVHDAMTQEETDEHEENTVIRQFVKGYQLNQRVLRPAQVVIARKPAEDAKKIPDKKEKKPKGKKNPSSVGEP